MNFIKYVVTLQLIYAIPLVGVYHTGLNLWTISLGVCCPVLYFYHVTESLLKRDMMDTFWLALLTSVFICGVNSMAAIKFHGHRQLEDDGGSLMIYTLAFLIGNLVKYIVWCGYSFFLEIGNEE